MGGFAKRKSQRQPDGDEDKCRQAERFMYIEEDAAQRRAGCEIRTIETDEERGNDDDSH